MATTSDVLMIDDDQDWVDVLQMAFQRAGVSSSVTGITDGAEAIRYLGGEGPYANRAAHPLPTLVLLDLRLPGMHGFEVLDWIRHQPELSALPVVVLTGMPIAADLDRARKLGANAVLSKPYSFPNTIGLARELGTTWLHQSPPPPGNQRRKAAA